MAANILTSVQDAVKREYDYIVVGAYMPCLRLPSLPRRMRVCSVIGGGVSTPVSYSMCQLRLTHADRRPRRRYALI